MTDYLTATEAMARLGIKQQTLYAYASRKLIRRIRPGGSRQSLYSREDVEKLVARRADRASVAAPYGDAIGGPVSTIASRITQISSDGPLYRGRDFRLLAAHPGRIENVAELLWSGVLLDEPTVWDFGEIPSNMEAAISALRCDGARVPILRVMATASIVLGESASNELRTGSTAILARRLVSSYAGCLGLLTDRAAFVRPEPGESVADIALRVLHADNTPANLAALNAVLICCADHELSPATFAARVVASTGAGLHACLLAAIAAHSGHQLGGACDQIEEQFLQPTNQSTLDQRIASHARSGVRLPGFNHPLYPNGDPRAAYLLGVAEKIDSAGTHNHLHPLIAKVEQETGQLPALELGLVAVARALNLPRRSAGALWAVGRSVGWVAHVIEQRLAGNIIRPRAHYRQF